MADLIHIPQNSTSVLIPVDLLNIQGNGLSYAPIPTQLIAPAAAPTLTATGGGSTGGLLAAGTYYAKFTLCGPGALGGETTVSPESAQLTVAAGNIPQANFGAGTTNGQFYKLYLTAANGASGTEVLYATNITGATYALYFAAPGGASPPGSNTSLSSSMLIYYFRDADTVSTAIPVYAGTLGTWTNSGANYGWIPLDTTHMIGDWQLSLPNAMFVGAVGTRVQLRISGLYNGLDKIIRFGIAPPNSNALLIDSTGHVALAATPPTAAQIATTVWQDTTAGDFSVASSIGLKVSGNLDTNVGSRLATSGYTVPPTTAQIATTVWQDTTAGDFSVLSSIGHQITINLDVNTGSRLATAGYTVPPTTAQIATGVWQDSTAGDFTVASSVGIRLMSGSSLLDSVTCFASGSGNPAVNARQAIAYAMAAGFGQIGGLPTSPDTYSGPNSATVIATVTTDTNFNRTSVVLNNPPS